MGTGIREKNGESGEGRREGKLGDLEEREKE